MGIIIRLSPIFFFTQLLSFCDVSLGLQWHPHLQTVATKAAVSIITAVQGNAAIITWETAFVTQSPLSRSRVRLTAQAHEFAIAALERRLVNRALQTARRSAQLADQILNDNQKETVLLLVLITVSNPVRTFLPASKKLSVVTELKFAFLPSSILKCFNDDLIQFNFISNELKKISDQFLYNFFESL